MEDLAEKEVQLADKVAETFSEFRDEIHKVIVGQDEIIKQIFITLLCGGHCLIIGVPGLAKTLMVRTIAKVLGLKFSRIQFTPDLMPADITGTDIIEDDKKTGKRNFRFLKGPLFANIILADEINRTPPKTQSALLEAMQEHQVSAGNKTYPLELPFIVLATQNPIEQEGTYPLPEAQLDRFLLNILIDYPPRSEEEEMVKLTTSPGEEEPKSVITSGDILNFQRLVMRVPASDYVIGLATEITRATRPDEKSPEFVKEYIRWGAGPRGSQHLVLTAKAHSLIEGKYIPDKDDIMAMVYPVLRHRIVNTFAAEAENISSDQLLKRVIDFVLKE
jgi:MoxR-like ATPase